MAGKSSIQLIVAADEPALFFASVREAEIYLEAADVEAGVYPAAYGPDGEVFRLEAAGGRVLITPLDGVAPRPEALRALVLGYLRAIGVQGPEDAEDLAGLLARCEAATIGAPRRPVLPTVPPSGTKSP